MTLPLVFTLLGLLLVTLLSHFWGCRSSLRLYFRLLRLAGILLTFLFNDLSLSFDL